MEAVVYHGPGHIACERSAEPATIEACDVIAAAAGPRALEITLEAKPVGREPSTGEVADVHV